MIRLLALALTVAISLSGCGRKVDLQPQPGKSLPVKPQGAKETPNAAKLLKPGTQAKPQRSDEQLKRSEERQDDEFDLPPSTR
jgi:uncharacterized protein YceK